MPGCPNQDAHLVVQITPNLMLAAVFDGHGRHGHHTSARVRGVFEQQARFLAAARSSEDLVESLRNIFLWLQKALEQEGLAHYSGTTATVALIDSVANLVTVAHVGDSSLAVVKGARADARTTDHVVDEVAERRILAHGGEVRVAKVSNTEVRRIFAKGSKYPGLAMARSLGDQEAQRLGASFEPEFSFLPLQAGSSVVVASDGVWDMLDPAAAASYLAGASAAQPERGASDLARMLVAEARSRYALDGDVDDITAIVVQAAPQFVAPESRDRTRSQ
jgi:serine/threonine protein phosphatase PrpC